MPLWSKIRGHIVFVLFVILSFYESVRNFNLADNFWTVKAKALVFHISIPSDKTFPYLQCWPCDLDLGFLNLNLSTYLGTVNARALIFHMNIPCDKIFLLVFDHDIWPIVYKNWHNVSHILWQDLSTGIKICVLVILVILELASIGGINVSKTHLIFFHLKLIESLWTNKDRCRAR